MEKLLKLERLEIDTNSKTLLSSGFIENKHLLVTRYKDALIILETLYVKPHSEIVARHTQHTDPSANI